MTMTFSSFARTFKLKEGELIMVNSFTGCIVRLNVSESRYIEPAIKSELTENFHGNELVRNLVKLGFFVNDSEKEKTIAQKTLQIERDKSAFHLILMPHEDCNFRCSYCYENFEKGKMSNEVVSNTKDFLAKNIANYKSFNLSWFGGEPLLARDIVFDVSQFLQRTCVNLGVNYKAQITTNGYLLDFATANKLVQYGIKHFQITMDGPKELHDSQRILSHGGGSYDTILSNLLSLKSISGDFSVRIRINYSATSLDTILNWLPELAGYFSDDDRFFLSFHPIGDFQSNSETVGKQLFLNSSPQEMKFKLIEAGIENGFGEKTIRHAFAPHGMVCYAARDSSVVIGSDGQLYKCTVDFYSDHNMVGILKEGGELEVDSDKWNLWTKVNYKKKCHTCWFQPSCQARSCPLATIKHKNKEPKCCLTNKQRRNLAEIAVLGQRQ